MKKLSALLLSLLLAGSTLCACAQEETAAAATAAPEATVEATAEATEEPEESAEPEETVEDEEEYESVTINLGGLKGPTSIGMVKLLDDNDNGLTANTYNFTMSGSAADLTPSLLKGELDILAVPANLGAVLYNNSNGAVEMCAINTLGVLYVCEVGDQTINSWADLKGKTIYATGKGSTPEYALNYLLSQNGLDPETDVTIEWKSEATEVVSALAAEGAGVALLPQPFVTVAGTQLENFHVVLDLNESWNELDNGSQLITAGLIVRKEFADEHPEALAKFLEEYAASTEWVNANVEEAAQLVEERDIVKAAVAEKAIPACNIVCITGEEMKEATSGYFNVLYEQNPDSVGGTLPADDFYWINE